MKLIIKFIHELHLKFNMYGQGQNISVLTASHDLHPATGKIRFITTRRTEPWQEMFRVDAKVWLAEFGPPMHSRLPSIIVKSYDH